MFGDSIMEDWQIGRYEFSSFLFDESKELFSKLVFLSFALAKSKMDVFIRELL